MESFTVMLKIYNLSMGLIVTPLDSKPFYFKIETTTGGPNSMLMNRMPDHSWNADCIQMKYFTHKNVQRLGALIELEQPGLFTITTAENLSPL
jgi:hypothetical protein